jgi:hypothetical protein
MKKFFGVGLLVLAVAVAAFPSQLSFKLTGGLNWINGDDYNAGITGYNSYLAAHYPPVTGAFSTLTSGMKLQGEAILWFTPNIGVGFGAGYSQIKKDDTVTYIALVTDTIKYAPNLSVIPLFLNFHYLLPAASFLNIDFYGGPVLYLTSLKFTASDVWLLWNLQDSFESTGTAFGFQAGLGLDFQLASSIALVLDASYHFGQLSEVKGTQKTTGSFIGIPINTTSANSYLWKYTSDGFNRVELNPNQPSGGSKAVLNLAGIALSAGIKIGL